MIRVKSEVLEIVEKEFHPEAQLPLLDQLENAGVTLPFGCRAGSCGSCRVAIQSGLELLETAGPMEQDTLDRCEDPASVRLACRARFKEGKSSGFLHLVKAKEL